MPKQALDFGSMNNLRTLSSALTLVALCALSTSAYGQDVEQLRQTQGPHYKVVWGTDPPEVYWDDQPAPDQLTVTAEGLGYATDADGRAQLVLDWREGGGDLMDRAYCGESFFDWALGQVKAGKTYDPDDYRSTKGDARASRTSADVEVPTWSGERVVALSNPGHELRFVITRDGATATDNGEPVEVTGRDGNYRVYAEDYECGVSVRSDGYVYHYYRPR